MLAQAGIGDLHWAGEQASTFSHAKCLAADDAIGFLSIGDWLVEDVELHPPFPCCSRARTSLALRGWLATTIATRGSPVDCRATRAGYCGARAGGGRSRGLSALAVLLVLCSAVLHATWNAALKSSSGDRTWAMTVMCATTAVMALPVALLSPAPAREAWPYLAASSVLQVAYCIFLVRAYRTGHLAQVYPIARGSSPLLVTIGALVFAHEALGGAAVAGVALASSGIIGLAAGRGRPDRASLVNALVTGVFIASYTIVDGLGARASGHAIAYAACLFVMQGSAMALLYALRRGPLRVDLRSRETWKAVGGGLLSVGSYGTVVWALSAGPMGSTSALRETSVLFAALIGRVFLREPLGVARVVACVAVAGGAVLLAFART